MHVPSHFTPDDDAQRSRAEVPAQRGGLERLRCSSCGAERSEGARFCTRCGARVDGGRTGVPADEPEPGERRQLTILFCDLVGSTQLASTSSPPGRCSTRSGEAPPRRAPSRGPASHWNSCVFLHRSTVRKRYAAGNGPRPLDA
jgi:hypothetical protein